MSAAVVFTYAIDSGVAPVVGAAPFDVLARQVPRALVAQLNGATDRGIRFFPFVGPIEGSRGFLRLRELLEPKALQALHKQGDVDLLVDGMLFKDRLQWRVIDGHSGSVRKTLDIPFDPLAPFLVLPRLAFELTGMLGWTGASLDTLNLKASGLSWYLVLKDEMLRREANLPDSSHDPLRAARQCIEFAGEDRDAQELLLDYFALLLRRGQLQEQVAEVAKALSPKLSSAASIDRLGGLMCAAGEEDVAAKLVVRAALLAPENSDLVERAASMAFRAGDDAGIRQVVEAARAANAVTASMIAQLAASYDRRGDVARRQELIAELLGHSELPVPVARLVTSFLLEEDQPALARTVIEGAINTSPDQAVLHYELGRACLILNDTARASTAFQRALDLGLPDNLCEAAKRLMRLSLVPGLWIGTNLVEKAIAAGDLGAALGAVRVLVRRVGPVAEAWLMFGIVQHKLGKLRRAEKLLRRSLGYYEECAEAHNRLGIVLLQSGRVVDGGGHLSRALQLSPNDTSTLLHLAQAAALSGRYDQAEQHIDRAEALGADQSLVQAVRREIRAA
jgi:tetratricopeptide (TPR) repeat protein